MILKGETIREIGIVTPHLQRFVASGMSGGEQGSCYDLSLGRDVTLVAGYTVLAVALERTQFPLDVIGLVMNKSTLARLGVCAAKCTKAEEGWSGHLTFEMTFAPLLPERFFLLRHWRNVFFPRRATIKAGTPIASMLCAKLDGQSPGYGAGKYADQPPVPVPARFEGSGSTLANGRERCGAHPQAGAVRQGVICIGVRGGFAVASPGRPG